jgi:hypothetical protein
VRLLVTVFSHTRDAAALAERLGARIWAPARGRKAIERRAGREAGGLRLCPQGWLPQARTHDDLRASLRPLLDLPVERVLVSHGEPVLEQAAAALRRVLATP